MIIFNQEKTMTIINYQKLKINIFLLNLQIFIKIKKNITKICAQEIVLELVHLKPDAINLNGKASSKYSNIKSNRSDSSSYENLKSDILDFTKKNKKIIIACSSLGSSERVSKNTN